MTSTRICVCTHARAHTHRYIYMVFYFDLGAQFLADSNLGSLQMKKSWHAFIRHCHMTTMMISWNATVVFQHEFVPGNFLINSSRLNSLTCSNSMPFRLRQYDMISSSTHRWNASKSLDTALKTSYIAFPGSPVCYRDTRSKSRYEHNRKFSYTSPSNR